jgi:hypothetical protein
MRAVKTLILLLVFMSSSADASTITFGGTLLKGTNLSTITFLDFNSPSFVTSVDGDLAAFVSVPDVATFKDFSFNPFIPDDPLWSVSGYDFKLTSIVIDSQTANGLVLIGSGLINGNTLVDSPFDFSFSADSIGGVVAFSATNVDTPTPEPSTLLLLGSALVFLSFAAKKKLV